MEEVTFTTTFTKLKRAGACESGYKKLAVSLGGITRYGRYTPINLLQILDSNGVDDCLWSLRAVDHPDRDRIARYIACDCAESVLSVFETLRPNDSRPRDAIAVARRFADGQATADERAAARDAAGAAGDAARDAAGAAARDAAGAAARDAAGAATWAAAGAAARDAAGAATWAAAGAAGAAAGAAERAAAGAATWAARAAGGAAGAAAGAATWAAWAAERAAQSIIIRSYLI
jgi:hypothetical protein